MRFEEGKVTSISGNVALKYNERKRMWLKNDIFKNFPGCDGKNELENTVKKEIKILHK